MNTIARVRAHALGDEPRPSPAEQTPSVVDPPVSNRHLTEAAPGQDPPAGICFWIHIATRRPLQYRRDIGSSKPSEARSLSILEAGISRR